MRVSSCIACSVKALPAAKARGHFHFVPQHESVKSGDIKLIQDYVQMASRLFVITGNYDSITASLI